MKPMMRCTHSVSSGRASKIQLRRLLLSAGLLLCAASSSAGVMFEVTIDTTALLGTPGQLAFDLIDSDPASNSATISGFTTDGTLGAVMPLGGPITGTLPGTVILEDADLFFNELAQNMTFGTTLSFFVELTTNNTSPFPDSFSFFLLNPATMFPLFGTTDTLFADSLFAIDIDGTETGDLNVFGAADAPPPATWTVTPVNLMPEPGTVILLLLGLGGFVHRERFRKRRR